MPDTARGLDPRVDEELVVCLWVVLPQPAGGEGARFIFHAAADLGWDAVAGFVGCGDLEVGGGGLLLGFGVGWWWVGGLHF